MSRKNANGQESDALRKRRRCTQIIMCAVVTFALGACVFLLWDVTNAGVVFFR